MSKINLQILNNSFVYKHYQRQLIGRDFQKYLLETVLKGKGALGNKWKGYFIMLCNIFKIQNYCLSVELRCFVLIS